ncbi:MAG: fused MFS/spermidine synthase [Bryobacterales bacterium]|nr:fused MFS/spermidine synthase [Bryobacterales bacterium]MDE0293022.1 fused MFS/spermidine synthase [Bryobacterales bacterium]
MKRLLSPFALGFVLLAEGWASLGTEILALRRLTPWAGSSVDVTSVLLAVYLAALAGGYRRGGRLARLGDPRPRLARRLAAAALWSAFWLSEPGILLAFSLPAAPLAQTFAYAVVGIAPVGWLLAECVLLAHACAAPRDASERAGGVFALSTVGNVTGALAATFLLLPTLGLAAAVFSVMAASAAAALVVSHRSVSVHVLILAACWPSLDLWVEATQYVSRNAYADYQIVAIDDDARVLVINSQYASRHDPQGQGWEYAELLERTLCGAGELRVLVLGAAGMSIGQGAPCELQITFVDIDPEQEKIAAQFLGVPEDKAGEFAGKDARTYLRGSASGWQAIVVDAFTNPRSMPRHLLTAEFYRLARSRLADGGSLYVNHLAYPGEELFLTRAERTLRSVFSACTFRAAELPSSMGWHEEASFNRNLLFRCTKSPLDGDRVIYSDSVSRADLDRSLRLRRYRDHRTMFREGDSTHE